MCFNDQDVSFVHKEQLSRLMSVPVPKNTIFTGGLEYHTQFKNNETLPSFSFHFITNNLKWRHECIAFFIKRFREIREKHGTEAKNIQLNESLLVKKLIEENGGGE